MSIQYNKKYNPSNDKRLLDNAFFERLLTEHFNFRTIQVDQADEVVAIEKICFPPHEACSEKAIKERIAVASDLFLVAVDDQTKKVAGFLNGIATDEHQFRDDFFKDASLHHSDGENIMLLGLDVLPQYRGKGLAHEIVYQYLIKERNRGRKKVTLTCLKEKVQFYKNMGFMGCGRANSNWGNEVWCEMTYTLNN